jgi:dCMP deaminase
MNNIEVIKEGELGTRPNWDEYFMHIAIGIASRSSCHNVHSGTVIVGNKQIIGEGYNGAPSGIKKNCLETGCRKTLKGLNYEESLNSGTCIGEHSEINAISHISKLDPIKISIYTTIFPCFNCAKRMLSYNVEKIVFKRFYSDKEFQSTIDLLNEAGVKVYQLDLSPERDLDIRFDHPNVRFDVWSDEEKQQIKNLMREM